MNSAFVGNEELRDWSKSIAGGGGGVGRSILKSGL